jgi:hypothetical protein
MWSATVKGLAHAAGSIECMLEMDTSLTSLDRQILNTCDLLITRWLALESSYRAGYKDLERFRRRVEQCKEALRRQREQLVRSPEGVNTRWLSDRISNMLLLHTF